MEAQQATAAAEARSVVEVQLMSPVVVVLPATSVAEVHPVPAATGTWLEAAVVAPQQEPEAAEVQSEVVVEARQEPALAGSSQATAVEIPDDDAPPPGWDQWASLPTPTPEPQAGALVRWWDDHMVAGGSRRGAEASSSRAGPPASGEGRVDEPPPSSPTPRRSSNCGRSSAITTPRSTEI
jgi:hypothetical protein